MEIETGITDEGSNNQETLLHGVDVERLVMPFGMKRVPLGWPLMAGAFIDFALYAIGVESFRDEFKAETGIDITSLVPRNGLERMIDEATGNDGKEVISSFLDWLVTSCWGEKGHAVEI